MFRVIRTSYIVYLLCIYVAEGITNGMLKLRHRIDRKHISISQVYTPNVLT